MKKSIKIVVGSIIGIVLVLVVLIMTGVMKGYYYKTDMEIGNKPVYYFRHISPIKEKCIDIAIITEDDDYQYTVSYSCSYIGPYIKEDGRYLQLDEAIEKGLITPQEVLDSDVSVHKDEKYHP